MFWKNFVSLCNEKRLSPNAVCSELGYSTAIATKWKNGSIPRSSTLQKIADYFGVTVESLTEETVVKTESIAPSPAQKFMESLPLDSLDDEELQKLVEYAEFLVSQKRKKK